MNAELKTHKDLDAWKDLELWTHDSRPSTLDWFSVTHYSSPSLAFALWLSEPCVLIDVTSSAAVGIIGWRGGDEDGTQKFRCMAGHC